VAGSDGTIRQAVRSSVRAILVGAVLAACSGGTPTEGGDGPPDTAPTAAATAGGGAQTAAGGGAAGDPCSMATADELTAATSVEFDDGRPDQLPAGDPLCRWPLVGDGSMIVPESGYVMILFRPLTLERAQTVDGGEETTIGGRPAVVGGGQGHGVANIDAGNGTVLRVELSLGPAVLERYGVLVSDLIDNVAAVAAGHL
jgi:hypothetical protein